MTRPFSGFVRLSLIGMLFAGVQILTVLADTHNRSARAQSPDLEPALRALHGDPLRHALQMEQPFAVELARRFTGDIRRYREAIDLGQALWTAHTTGLHVEQCNAENVRRGLESLERRLRGLGELLQFFEDTAARNSAWEQAVDDLQRHLGAHVHNWAEAQKDPLRFEPGTTLLPDELAGAPLPPVVEVVDTALAFALEIVITIPRATWELEANRETLGNFEARFAALHAWRQVLLLARDEARNLHQHTQTYHDSLERLITRLRSEFHEHACERQCLEPEEIDALELPPPPDKTAPIVHPHPTGSASRHAVVERAWSGQLGGVAEPPPPQSGDHPRPPPR